MNKGLLPTIGVLTSSLISFAGSQTIGRPINESFAVGGNFSGPGFYESESTYTEEGGPVEGDPEEPEEPDEPEEPYEIFGGDESSSYSDAESITVGTTYNRCFNDHNDYDYFLISLNRGSAFTITCSISCTIKLFRYSHELYFAKNSSSSGAVPIDTNGNYYLMLKGPSNFTGYYTIAVTNSTPPSSNKTKYYIRHKMVNSSVYGPELFYADYSTKPDYGSREQRITQVHGINSSISTTDYTSIETFGTSNNVQYVSASSSTPGVYNASHVATNLISDDNRTRVPVSDFPGDTVCHTRSFIDSAGSYNIGTSFFVDEDYLFSAAHMAFNDTGWTFTRSMTIDIEKNLSTKVQTLQCKEIILPYFYFARQVSNVTERSYDWAIIRIDHTDIYSWYVHGYLGLKYTYSTSFSGETMGYPAYYEITNVNSEKYINAVDFGSYSLSNGVLTTYVDITEGQSGGPMFTTAVGSQGQYKLYAQGIVSGGTANGSGNKLCAVNKYNYHLLLDLIGGNV